MNSFVYGLVWIDRSDNFSRKPCDSMNAVDVCLLQTYKPANLSSPHHSQALHVLVSQMQSHSCKHSRKSVKLPVSQ